MRIGARVALFLLAAAASVSVAFLARDRSPLETAYTQDGANCVRGRVRDQENKPLEGARVTLVEEKSLAGIAATLTDKKGEFTFRTVPFRQELMLMVEADGFSKVSIPGITVVPPYSFVALVRLQRLNPKPSS
jgi:hypothetical protein